jgi:hypothetical protein
VDDVAPEVRERYERVIGVLREARGYRPQPARDNKVVAAWTGLAIVALVEFGFQAAGTDTTGTDTTGGDAAGTGTGSRATATTGTDTTGTDTTGGDTAGTGTGSRATATTGTATSDGSERREADRDAEVAWELARSCGALLRDLHLADGRLRRVSRDGVTGTPQGVLDDYGAVAEALCALHQLTGEGEWLRLAGGLLETAITHFTSGLAGEPAVKIFDTADFAETLVARPSDPTDNASPAGVSTLAAALTTYAALSGGTRYRSAAKQALTTVSGVIAKHPRYAGYAGAVAEAQVSGPYEIAVAASAPDAGNELVAQAWRLAPPGAVVVAGAPDRPGVPLLGGRPLLAGVPTVYVCRGFVCDRPVTDARSLAAQLVGTASR